ncbi:MAG: tRNA (adenosine(37)-N6)-threonylcarbamoyltransferase complex ATPase subunit type 1 TsaE, partial [Patescibacteria group bacterium]
MKKEILSHSGRQTKLIGEKLAKEVFTNKREKGSVFSLEGELGSGKTTFLQGFAKELGVREFIKSPTFVIMKKYR